MNRATPSVTVCFQWDIVSNKGKLLVAGALTGTSGEWTGLDDLMRVYSKTFPEPAVSIL